MIRTALSLDARVDALDDAVSAGRGRIPDEVLDAAADVAARARERAGLSAEYTVVALAGSTGSGKSSLMNALAGQPVAVAGARRPTTGRPLAVVWSAPGETSGGAHALLDWLAVRDRHAADADPALPDPALSGPALPGPAQPGPAQPGPPLPGPAQPAPAVPPPTGLVLLDLPDHDSVEVRHRLVAERLYERVDLLVWVVDPQKYADAALHVRYLRPLAQHAAVVVLVLNHADRLTDAERATCVEDLRRLAVDDGLSGVPVLAVSARTGSGVGALRDRLADAAARRVAATDRVRADVCSAAATVLDACGTGTTRPTGTSAALELLVDTLEVAAGVPTVVEAVRRSSARRARMASGWPPVSWLARLRPDPLRRLGLGARRGAVERPDLARTSLRARGAAEHARAANAVRGYVDGATAGAPDVWVLAARGRVTTAGLDDALDQAVAGTRLEVDRDPRWWGAARGLQRVLLAVAVAGLAWLGLLAGLAYLRLPELSTPQWSGVPVPTALALGGVLAGLAVAILGRLVGSVGARRRAAAARVRLRTAIDTVADARVVDLVGIELDALARCRDSALLAASDADPGTGPGRRRGTVATGTRTEGVRR